MRKYLILIAISALMASTVVSAETSTKYKGFDTVTVKVNGSTLKLDVPAIIMDGRTLLPLRKVAESMNSVVLWDASTKTASVIKPQVNIMFTETQDGVGSFGQPSETIPYWSEYDRYLTYISISGLPAGDHQVLCSLHKINAQNNLLDSTAIDSKPTHNVNVEGPNHPVIFSIAWDKSVIKTAGVYALAVSIKDGSGSFTPVAVHRMELK